MFAFNTSAPMEALDASEPTAGPCPTGAPTPLSDTSLFVWAAFMLTFSLVGAIGNAMTIAAIALTPILRTSANCLVALLAINDGLLGLYFIPSQVVQALAYRYSSFFTQ